MKLVKESIYNFHKTGDIKSSLDIGRVANIRKWFRDLGYSDKDYLITDTEVIFGEDLDLENTDITKLPDGLNVRGYLDLRGTLITELPEGLKVGRNLFLMGTGITELPADLRIKENLHLWETDITELPDGLSIGGYIYIDPLQEELKSHIRSSKFASRLKISGEGWG